MQIEWTLLMVVGRGKVKEISGVKRLMTMKTEEMGAGWRY